MNTIKKQRMKMPKGGSFQNWLMSNNSTLPKVGEYATIMSYTDRDVAIVREVSADGMQCVIEDCHTVAKRGQDGNYLPMGHQCWEHTPSGHKKTLRWYRGKWCIVGREIVFTEEFRKSIDSEFIGIHLHKNNPELLKQVYGDHHMPINVVPGVTREKKTYAPMRILFGACDYYYDWTF